MQPSLPYLFSTLSIFEVRTQVSEWPSARSSLATSNTLSLTPQLASLSWDPLSPGPLCRYRVKPASTRRRRSLATSHKYAHSTCKIIPMGGCRSNCNRNPDRSTTVSFSFKIYGSPRPVLDKGVKDQGVLRVCDCL